MHAFSNYPLQALKVDFKQRLLGSRYIDRHLARLLEEGKRKRKYSDHANMDLHNSIISNEYVLYR
jgi:hypothetical protein